MVDPYRMVAINIITSALLFIGIIFYRFIYPKKKINLFFLLILISFLPLLSILREGDYESGDFNIHVYRIMSFYDSLKEGQFMPSWSAELNATYGIPLFIFNYSLPYYAVSLLHFIGFSFIASLKTYLALTFFLSGIFMYYWVKKLTNNEIAAFTSSIFYLFSPYHLIDIHFRATPGESTIFTLAPLAFFFITKYFEDKTFTSLIFISLFTSLLFLAHPQLAIVIFGMEILFILFLTFKNKEFKTLIFSSISLITGLIASIYTWIPFILYAPYTYKDIYSASQEVLFYPFNQILYSPWMYGFLFQGHRGEQALIIGYTQIFVLIASVILIVIKKVPKKILNIYIFWIFLCLIIIFMMNPLSGFIWKYIYNFSGMFTLYARLLLAISFCISIISGYFVLILLKSTKMTYVYLLLIITIGSTTLNWGHRRVIPEINDTVLQKNVWKGVQITPPFMNSKWVETPTFWFPERPDKSLEIITGIGNAKLLRKTSTNHSYIINAQTPITIRENTLYFPNWLLKSNNKNIPIYPDAKGVINAKLTQGLQYVELTYEDLPLYRLSKIISAGIFLGMFFILIFYQLHMQIKKRGLRFFNFF